MAHRRHAGGADPGVEDVAATDKDGTTPNFQTYCVLEFAPKVPAETVAWLVDKITCCRAEGGGALQAQRTHPDEKMGELVHISASTDRLLLAAELMEVKKPYNDGTLREVTLDDLKQFQDSEDLDSFLYDSEKQRITLHELELIRATDADKEVPGFPKIKLYKGQAIVAKLMKDDVVLQVFPLHDKEQLKELGSRWYQSYKQQPLEDIRRYFGETVAMYFSFLGVYTAALVPPALLGFIVYITSFNSVTARIIIAVFNLVWATVFLEVWKRHAATLAFNWGTIHTEKFEEARAAYHGELGVNKITGRLEPKYPKWKRALKFYGASLPAVLFCLYVAFVVMLVYFWIESHAYAWAAKHPGLGGTIVMNLPCIVYSVIIVIMNAIYRKIAKALTDWENHRLESAYQNHLILKLVLFDFMNCFVSLFYIAFYMQDLVMLRTTLATLLIVQQIIGQLLESALPYIMYKSRKVKIKKQHSQQSNGEVDGEEDSSRISEVSQLQAHIDATKDQFWGTLDDYLEMFLQFGYVFLFSSVFPSAAIWALLNNITEIRTDAFKFCRIFQRPFAQTASGIGAWQVAFEMMSVMAVVTNCALLLLSPKAQEFMTDFGTVTVLVWFILAEHGVLFVKAAISSLIPDEPGWVQDKLARAEYQSKLAWRKQIAWKASEECKMKVKEAQEMREGKAGH